MEIPTRNSSPKYTNCLCHSISKLHTPWEKMRRTLNENREFKWQDENRINNKSCWLDSIKAIVTWAAVTSLKPGQAWFPRMDCHGADGAGEGVPASEPCPMDLVNLLSSTRAHNLQIQAGPPAVKLRLLHPKDMEPLGWKSFEKPRGLHVSWWWGSYLQPPSLASHLRMKALSPQWCCRKGDVSRGEG